MLDTLCAHTLPKGSRENKETLYKRVCVMLGGIKSDIPAPSTNEGFLRKFHIYLWLTRYRQSEQHFRQPVSLTRNRTSSTDAKISCIERFKQIEFPIPKFIAGIYGEMPDHLSSCHENSLDQTILRPQEGEGPLQFLSLKCEFCMWLKLPSP